MDSKTSSKLGAIQFHLSMFYQAAFSIDEVHLASFDTFQVFRAALDVV